jgi:hypothetical protein
MLTFLRGAELLKKEAHNHFASAFLSRLGGLKGFLQTSFRYINCDPNPRSGFKGRRRLCLDLKA